MSEKMPLIPARTAQALVPGGRADASAESDKAHIRVRDLTMRYGDRVIQHDLSFDVRHSEVFIIMGGSGCGKSTLLRHLIGLKRPSEGRICYDGVDFWNSDAEAQAQIMRRFGVLYQSGALWSSMTLAENISVPLKEFTELSDRDIRDVARLKLALVGLAGFEDYYPSEISGGMRKRAGLARAMALDPEILFFDEPSAGLDPLSSRQLDELVLELKENLGSTIVVVTHELASIFAIGDHALFLDASTHTMLAEGPPCELRDACPVPKVRAFLNRGQEDPEADSAHRRASEAGQSPDEPPGEKTA